MHSHSTSVRIGNSGFLIVGRDLERLSQKMRPMPRDGLAMMRFHHQDQVRAARHVVAKLARSVRRKVQAELRRGGARLRVHFAPLKRVDAGGSDAQTGLQPLYRMCRDGRAADIRGADGQNGSDHFSSSQQRHGHLSAGTVAKGRLSTTLAIPFPGTRQPKRSRPGRDKSVCALTIAPMPCVESPASCGRRHCLSAPANVLWSPPVPQRSIRVDKD